MDLEELQAQLTLQVAEHNNQSMPEFEGYSPFEMYHITYYTFDKDSPLQLQRLSTSDYKKIPILNQIKYLTNLIEKHGEIKLTNRGFLPVKIVTDIYQQGFLKEEQFEKGYIKLCKESDSRTINLTRILLELSGLTRKKLGKLSLTKKSKKILEDDFETLNLIFSTFATKFNWSYYDGFDNEDIGQLGFGFSLILLSKYGKEKLLDSFYAEKYFKAFPSFLETDKPITKKEKDYNELCYSLRTFKRFLDYFGLINIQTKKRGYSFTHYISKTDIYDKLIKCTPHKVRCKPLI